MNENSEACEADLDGNSSIFTQSDDSVSINLFYQSSACSEIEDQQEKGEEEKVETNKKEMEEEEEEKVIELEEDLEEAKPNKSCAGNNDKYYQIIPYLTAKKKDIYCDSCAKFSPKFRIRDGDLNFIYEMFRLNKDKFLMCVDLNYIERADIDFNICFKEGRNNN